MGFGCSGLGMGSWMGLGGGWGSLLLTLALGIGVLALLGVGTALLARQFRGRPAAVGTGDAPLEIARRRLAAGEISIPEYEEIRGRLQS